MLYNHEYGIINYEYYNFHYKSTIIILHGWGCNIESYHHVIVELKKKFNILIFDLLGFGLSSDPIVPLCLDDYVKVLTDLITYLDIKNYIIIGHSFGGRIAIRYCTTHKIKKLVLMDSAGISKTKFKTKLLIIKYKIKKMIIKIFNKKKLLNWQEKHGSKDYKNANMIMKETMKKVIKEKLHRDLSFITSDTLILWGMNDNVTPINDGIYMNKYIKNSKFIRFFNSGHFPYLDETNKFINVLKRELYDN